MAKGSNPSHSNTVVRLAVSDVGIGIGSSQRLDNREPSTIRSSRFVVQGGFEGTFLRSRDTARRPLVHILDGVRVASKIEAKEMRQYPQIALHREVRDPPIDLLPLIADVDRTGTRELVSS